MIYDEKVSYICSKIKGNLLKSCHLEPNPGLIAWCYSTDTVYMTLLYLQYEYYIDNVIINNLFDL